MSGLPQRFACCPWRVTSDGALAELPSCLRPALPTAACELEEVKFWGVRKRND